MAFVLLQFWGQPPIIYEELMGDSPVAPQTVGDLSNNSRGAKGNVSQQLPASQYAEIDARNGQQGNPPVNIMQGDFPNTQFIQQHNDPHVRPDSFNMASFGSTLPEYQQYGNFHQRYSTGPSSPLQYQAQNQQYLTSTGMNPSMPNMAYGVQYQPQYQGAYAPGHTSPQNLPVGGSQYYSNHGYIGQQQPQQQQQQQQHPPPFYVQPNQYTTQNQIYPGSIPSSYAGRGGLQSDGRLPTQRVNHDYLGSSTASNAQARSNSVASSAGQSSVVRGPPRKPRQSGHAIWIGNLPPHTDLMSLVLHVCKETVGLESLFLISKSNCAFANFKDEESCATAQAKIHDSRFQTVRLVSRLRRSSVGVGSGVSIPTGPAALLPPSNVSVARAASPDVEATKIAENDESKDEAVVTEGEVPKDKFFVVKSLTVEDLELSVRNGIWATQAHNEETLNKAYETADNVYLVFSANKSGEYFGYAKMVSPINNDPAAAIEFAPMAQTVEDPELPKAIPTPATEFAPKGRIIDDSARGTIFWEAEREETDISEEEDDNRSDRSDHDTEDSSKKAWGKPFKVEWVSTTRLPFYRTRGLRNPWNSNREVKIARDGTELETAVGRRLLGLFHRLPSPVQPSVQSGTMLLMGGYPPVL